MSAEREIDVVADWAGLGDPQRVGVLNATVVRGQEVLAFEYDATWLVSGFRHSLDPNLGLYAGRQFSPAGRESFGVFLDSCPDRWGRFLMQRREAYRAREGGRPLQRLQPTDYLLGVYDPHRLGGLRFAIGGRYLDEDDTQAAPPWTSLRELQAASLALQQPDAEREPEFARWLRMLVKPGSSLGGARPKAGVLDPNDALWVAKFPSRDDEDDIGAWEFVVHSLARRAGINVPDAAIESFGAESMNSSGYHTFLSRRFDRTPSGERVHFASAMTMLDRIDGERASYVELAEFLIRSGAQTSEDLVELWRRIVFSICVANTDDHLRNHGFLLTNSGWRLSPAYDLNPNPFGGSLSLSISESDNTRDLDLALSVAEDFRISKNDASEICSRVVDVVGAWRETADEVGLSRESQDRMAGAFDVVESVR